MYKAIIFGFVLATLTFSLQVHLEDASPATVPESPATAPEGPAFPFGDSPDAKKAAQRLMNFVTGDKEILASMKAGGQPDGAVLKKFMKFMINDKFFQQQIIAAIESTPQNAWLKPLSLPAKVRFLRIVTKYDEKQLQNPKTQKRLTALLLRDRQLGPALKKQFGDNVNMESLTQAASAIGKASSMGHLLSQMLSQ